MLILVVDSYDELHFTECVSKLKTILIGTVVFSCEKLSGGWNTDYVNIFHLHYQTGSHFN
jgi:hypothetical protein